MLISEHFRYRNDVFQSDIFVSDIGITDVDVGCQISPTLRSMSMPTYGHSSFIYCFSLFIAIVHLFCSLLDFHLFFVRLLFIIRCSKEKDSILILDCIPGILIPFNIYTCCTCLPSSSMQVDKHHTPDCTDFVLE
jgi:hypothetical protein